MKFNPVSAMISLAMQRRIPELENIFTNAEELQSQLLTNLVYKARNTAFGKAHGFSSIHNHQTYTQQVPIGGYHDFEPLIERIRQGEQNILWPTHIKWFAKSSGTTESKSKFLPLSFEAIEACHFKGGKDLLAVYCKHHPNTQMFAGFSLRLGGSTSINSSNHESYYGDLSAVLIENLPFWIEIRSTPNQRIALMSEWESKIEAISRHAIPQNVTSLFGVPSWMLVLCQRILEITGKAHMHEVWPGMELYCHGGVSFAPYRKQFEALFPNAQMSFLETYNASEGFFAIQDQPHSNDLLLLVNHGIFYEFIPMEHFDGVSGPTICLPDVELEKNYALVITTNSGLWRYLIGDTVRFTSKAPYRIQITGRTKHFINAFGEELIIDNAERAIKKACDELQVTVKEYSGAPIFMNGQTAGAHEWVFEFDVPPTNLQAFVEWFDAELKTVNSDYEAKRHKNMALRQPIVHVARNGLFYDWLKKHNKLGGQHKVPRLVNNRDLMEELLAMNQ
jgi:hypothetical protein